MRLGSFALFLSIFLSLYGGMHYYIYRKLILLLPSATNYLPWVLGLLVLSPVLIQLLINANWVNVARVLALIGYTWMGFAFIFFSFAVINDAVRGTAWLLGKLAGRESPLFSTLSSPQITGMILIFAVIACCYGVFSARQINVSRISFPTTKLPAGCAPLRIVQISDLHLGVLTEESRIRRMIAMINALHPDIFISTGDLVDMQADHINRYAKIFNEVRASYGRFAVTGNHEAIAGLKSALAFTRKAGFTVLSGEGQVINNEINLVGVDDPAVIRQQGNQRLTEQALLRAFNNGHVTVLLKHRPEIDRESMPYFDLQLSGHIHGGQIFPFGLLTRLVYRVKMGMSRVGPASWLYVSYGSGAWGPPIRLLAPPEITVIDIVPGENAGAGLQVT